jgi:hypothetical protein
VLQAPALVPGPGPGPGPGSPRGLARRSRWRAPAGERRSPSPAEAAARKGSAEAPAGGEGARGPPRGAAAVEAAGAVEEAEPRRPAVRRRRSGTRPTPWPGPPRRRRRKTPAEKSSSATCSRRTAPARQSVRLLKTMSSTFTRHPFDTPLTFFTDLPSSSLARVLRRRRERRRRGRGAGNDARQGPDETEEPETLHSHSRNRTGHRGAPASGSRWGWLPPGPSVLDARSRGVSQCPPANP